MIDVRGLSLDRRALAWVIGAIAVLAVLIGFVIIANPFAEAGPSQPPSPLARSSATPSPTATPEPEPTPTATPRPTAQPTPTPTPRPAALRDGRLTVLMLGSDSSKGRRQRTREYLTDAITVISVKENGRRLALVSLPRDTVDVPMPDGSLWRGKVNSLSMFRGAATMRDAMEVLLGIRIDHYVQMDMDDFRRVIRQLDGVRVRVPYAVRDVRCAIRAGGQVMHAERALCYARHRATDGDFARARRHQQLLLAIRDRMLRRDVDYLRMIRTFRTLETDVRIRDVPAFADLLRRSRHAQISRLVLAPPAFTTFVGFAGERGWIQVPNVPAIRQAVAAVLRL
jgi:LCP family protein required for cell wall assembly